jgi:predicted nucleic-acid-binding protein
MIAVDTNVVVRLLTKDDLDQAKRAAKLFDQSEIFIPKTVLLEAEWVLRHAYGIDKDGILSAFQRLIGLFNVKVEDAQAVNLALSWYSGGFDFADALHLAASKDAEEFATFDQSLLRKAGRVSAANLIIP